MEKYPDFVDEFPYADTAEIQGLISASGHTWNRSGGTLPSIIGNTLFGGTPSTSYAFMDVYAQPFYQYCDVTPEAGGNGVVLMASPDANSLENMTHFRFTLTTVYLEMRSFAHGNHSVVAAIPDINKASITYSSPMVAGTKYRVGIKYYGDLIGVILPDGSEYKFGSRAATAIVNRHLVFQPSNSKLSKVGCTMKSRNLVT